MYSTKDIGMNIVKYFRGLKLIKINIGDIYIDERRPLDGRYKITGLGIRVGDDISTYMNPIGIEVENNTDFLEIEGKSLKDFIVSLEEVDTDIIEVVDNVIKNRLVVMPFKLGVKMEVEYSGKVYNCKLASVIWKVDRQLGDKFKVYLIFEYEGKEGKKTFKYSVEEYGDKFIDSVTDKEVYRKYLSMSRFGYFKPIEIHKDGNVYVVDYSNLYKVTDKGCEVIGKWEGEKIKVNRGKSSKELSSLILEIEKVVEYKDLIAPYKLIETHKVECN